MYLLVAKIRRLDSESSSNSSSPTMPDPIGIIQPISVPSKSILADAAESTKAMTKHKAKTIEKPEEAAIIFFVFRFLLLRFPSFSFQFFNFFSLSLSLSLSISISLSVQSCVVWPFLGWRVY